MADISEDIQFYETIKNDLEVKFSGKWVLIHARKFIDTFNGFDEAAAEAVKKFGRGPYLIRQIAAPPVVLPASVAYIFQKNA